VPEAPDVIPSTTALEKLYKRLSQSSDERAVDRGEELGEQAHHLHIARGLTGGALVDDFIESVATCQSYRNLQSFHDGRLLLSETSHRPLTTADLKTASIAWWLEAKDAEVRALDGTSLGLTYVDRELVPLRTSAHGGATSARSRRSRRLDLLLAASDGAPVISEIKAQTDQHPFYALVQLLMLAAQLATPYQRDRLSKHYPAISRTDGPLELCLVLAGNERYFFEPPGGWKRKPQFKPQLAQ
jgi:hypothetical protein